MSLIRKFDELILSDYDWERPFSSGNALSKIMLRLCGLWPADLCDKPTDLDFLTRKTNIFKIISYSVIFTSCLSEIINIACSLDDMHEIIETCCSILPIFFNVIMITNIVYRKYQLQHFIDELEDICMKVCRTHKSLFRKCFEKSRRFSATLWVLSMGTAITFCTLPVLSYLFEHKRSLPTHQWYPYNKYKSPMYEISYTFELIRCIVAGIIFSGHDAFFCTAMVFAGGCFKSICDDLENITSNSMNTVRVCNLSTPQMDSTFFHKEMNKQLCNIIQRHIRISKLCDEMDYIFSPIIVGHFLLHSCGICAIAWQIKMTMDGEISYDHMPFLTVYIVACIVELFVYCWYGTLIISESSQVSDAAFYCGWYNGDDKFKSTVVFLIQRAQKPSQIKICGIGTMSLEVFIAIIKTAMSYFTILQSLQEE